MTHRINLTLDRVREMDDREMYDLSDHYLKGRMARFAVSPETQSLLEQRDLPSRERDPEYSEVYNDFKQKLYEILYSEEILPRHHLALQRMARSVESQLEGYSDNDDWRPGAQGFLNLVKDEIGRVEIVLAEREQDSAKRQLETLLMAIDAHRNAEDADAADGRLYSIADQISETMELA